MGSVMRRVAAKRPAAELATAGDGAAMTIGVLIVSNPGSETTRVKAPGWGGVT